MRSFIPFGSPWNLSIPVPYSFLVRDRNMAWTCGQVPIDATSNVLAPNDLLGQTEIVCDYIEGILQRAEMQPGLLGKLVLYFVRQNPEDEARMMAYCRTRFGERPVLVPVAVPHFYFDGLLLEVDAFAGATSTPGVTMTTDGATVQIADGGELAWATVSVDPDKVTEGRYLLASALSEFGLNADQRLSEHWIAPAAENGAPGLAGITTALGRAGLLSDDGAVVESTDPAARVVGELTYVKAPVATDVTRIDGVKIVSRRSGRFGWFSARVVDDDRGLVSQTSRMMRSLADALDVQGMTFDDVVKSTSLYVGGQSAEALYENMAVRNARYQTPGPASTGLPVRRLADPNSLITVDVIAACNLPPA